MEPIKAGIKQGVVTVAAEVAAKDEANEAELNAPYIDKRSITVSPVHQYSAYRNANRKALGSAKYVIGSSITSCRILSSNKEEVEAYFPQLIGLSPNNPEFITRVKAYLSNIQVIVNDNGTTLDVSFSYNHKRDYLMIKAKEDKINEEYDKVNRADTSAIKEAVKKYVEEMNLLESTKHNYGRPVNLDQYLVYRHCLLYKDVAKDIALINSDSSLRFYIRNEQKEAEKARKLIEEKKAAMRNFIELNASDRRRQAVYIQMIVSNNGNVGQALLKTKNEQEDALMKYVNENPYKFNKLCSDKNIEMKSFVEMLVSRGELIRSEFNQQLTTPDGTFIGSNVKEAIAFFNNPTNEELFNAFKNKLKFI